MSIKPIPGIECMERLQVLKADITKLTVDVIVNAANSSLLGGGGVDGAVHRAAGPNLLIECRKLRGCDTGYVKITNAYDLPCKYVIHAVGPIWRGGGACEEELLRSCYREALKMAAQRKFQSMAFPAISCGVYGYPHADAVSIAVGEIRHFFELNTHPEAVTLVCFDQKLFELYSDEVKFM